MAGSCSLYETVSDQRERRKAAIVGASRAKGLPSRVGLEHNTNVWDDPTALERHQRRQAIRQRQRASQRADLIAAARVLIPEHGIAVPLSRIAVHAGLSRSTAAGLFNATSDLAVELISQAWHALGEALASHAAGAPEALLAALIDALRADAPALRIHQAMCCGAAAWQRAAIADADRLLARAIEYRLADTWPGLRPDADAPLGRRAFALARAAALAPALTPGAPDAHAEAAVIVRMLAPLPCLGAPAAAAAARGPAPAGRRPPAPAGRRHATEAARRVVAADQPSPSRPSRPSPHPVHDPPPVLA